MVVMTVRFEHPPPIRLSRTHIGTLKGNTEKSQIFFIDLLGAEKNKHAIDGIEIFLSVTRERESCVGAGPLFVYVCLQQLSLKAQETRWLM